MTVYYHPGKPGEVSHERAQAYVAEILANPFLRGSGTAGLLSRLSDPRWTRIPGREGKICAPGAMHAYLIAAALREATQGEG